VAKIKICGLFRPEDIDYANDASPDYIGFVFAPGRRHIDPSGATRFRGRLKEGIVPVGVFVNHPIDEIAALFRDGIIGMAQLHGNENAAYIRRLREDRGVPVIKAIRPDAIYAAKGDAGLADYCLIDSGAGSGRAFDWNLLGAHSASLVPWFLAGGIGVENIEAALSTGPYGIDVSSGAETDGVKDRDKMITLVRAARTPVSKNSGTGSA
jgi:phosphoribosylanthranilate isomerase